MLARVPIRLRLTLAFAAAMAVVLVAMGLFLYLRLGAALAQTIDQNLRGRADDVATLVRASDSRLPRPEGTGWSSRRSTSPRCSTGTAPS
jgi:two-component system OmpR family sensor kinase